MGKYFNRSMLSFAPGRTCFPFLKTPSTSKQMQGALKVLKSFFYLLVLIVFEAIIEKLRLSR